MQSYIGALWSIIGSMLNYIGALSSVIGSGARSGRRGGQGVGARYTGNARDERRLRECIEDGSMNVEQDTPREADYAGKRVQIEEAERRERLTQLVLCRTKLSAREAL